MYTGYTTNVTKRILTHNQGKGAKYTKTRLPVKLVHTERYLDKSQALKREYAIKQLTKNQKRSLFE